MSQTNETRRTRDWRMVLLATMAVAVAFLLAVVVVMLQSLEQLGPRGRNELETAERRVAAVGRRIDRMKEREELLDWIQQEIRGANTKLDAAAAREYGKLLLEITDKYKTVDPLFLLAVGIVESRFRTEATSHAHAKGLYQIWPATGRWLATELGWEFSEAMLYEPAKNTELAACYLDKLFHTYRDPRLVLAEYNGGPVNARRLKTGSNRLAAETRDYVVKVMEVHDGLNRRLDLTPAPTAEPKPPVRVAALGASTAFVP